MKWHLIEGEAGCVYAREQACVGVVVDALRASATAAMLFHHGAVQITLVREIEDAFRAQSGDPEALLFGERGGLPPEGFDHGNSPADTESAGGRRVVFTTTTGSGRVMDAWGAHAVYMGTTLNALGVVRAALRHDRDVVLIPAGLQGDPDFDAQEDWAAAAAIAMLADATVGEGALCYREWRQRVELDGLPRIFEAAPHADALREVGLERDIAFCARMNVTNAVPHARETSVYGVVLADGGGV